MDQGHSSVPSLLFGPLGSIAPTSRRKVTTVAASFVVFLALIGAILSFFNVTEEYATRPGAQKIIIPIAQFLGSLYGWTIVGAAVTENATLEFLWREINGLGTTTCLIGLLILIVGVVLGLVGVGGLFDKSVVNTAL